MSSTLAGGEGNDAGAVAGVAHTVIE